MELKPEVGGVKVLENLKRHLFDFQETTSRWDEVLCWLEL